MEPIIYKPSIYNGAGIYKIGAGGGGGGDSVPVGTILTKANNGVDFVDKEIICESQPLYIQGPFDAPTKTQSFEMDISFKKLTLDYHAQSIGVFSGEKNISSLMLQIKWEGGNKCFLGVPNEDGSSWYGWNDGSQLIDIGSYINQANVFYHIYLGYNIITHRLLFSIDNNIICDKVIPINPRFINQDYFKFFSNTGEQNQGYGKIKYGNVRIYNDERIF